MKKTDEALSRAQDKAQIYRQKLEAGKIRLVPEKPLPPIRQRDELPADQSKQADHKPPAHPH